MARRGGPDAAAAYGIFFVHVVAFSAYDFPARLAVLEVALAGVVYGVVLRALDHEAGPAQWVVVIAAAVVAGGIIEGLGQRARTLYDREQDTGDRLREVDEMKTTFLQAVSHELRTPLTAVGGCAEVLRSDHAELSGDRTELVLDRLQQNADELDGVDVTVEAVERGALITVDDRGPGVPDDLKEEIFEPLRQGPTVRDDAQPGTGIGLSLVASFVELHAGRAWVEDRPGGGARFRALLPDE